MSHGTEGSSQSGEKPKRKKKYLYLDRFENYQQTTDGRLNKTEHTQRIMTLVGVIFAISLLTLALYM